MTLYTSKTIAGYLNLTEKRVRQLRDEGVLQEKRPGLYELQPTVVRYINYLRGAGNGRTDLNEERAKLTKAKRETAEMENRLRRGQLHETADIQLALKTICMNFRTRAMALPAKLSPELSHMGGDQAGIFDKLQDATNEMLEELSDYRTAFADAGEMDDEGPEEKDGEQKDLETLQGVPMGNDGEQREGAVHVPALREAKETT